MKTSRESVIALEASDGRSIPPVLVLGYKRHESLRELLQLVRGWGVSDLYIALDGPKSEADREAVDNTRAVANLDLWAPRISRRFLDKNAGCKNSVSSAITWFFAHVDYGIILEEDVRVDSSFITLAAELLRRYAADERIMVVNSNFFVPAGTQHRDAVFQSKLVHPWGWATWSRAWQKYSDSLAEWDGILSFNKLHKLRHASPRWRDRLFFALAFKLAHQEKMSSWAYRWCASVWRSGGVSLTPMRNMCINVGVGEGATHTQKETQFLGYPVEQFNRLSGWAVADANSELDSRMFGFIYKSRSTWRLARMFVSTLVSRSFFFRIRKLVR